MKREKRGKMKKVTRSTDWLTSRCSDEELREMKIHAYTEADAQLKGERRMTNEEIMKEIQKLKEENSSLKSLLEALNTKVAQMQIKLNAISEKVDINTSYVLAN